ncbi:LOW QUALITY PROTEIN: pdgfa associated protein 1b [Astyanax mexicanus]|uniref:LOW QUALITY PROTEIN: pdgfa associated protein 1b n=1 Tax=Astyanax mexicanus TaxID=7994 RepID=UPI000BBDA45A|nr:LOW QUALITY PROTEIN: pdgfa associated protein 1b [Astyanax mexicanus]
MPKGGRKGGHKGRMRTYTSPEEIDAQMKAEKERKKIEEEADGATVNDDNQTEDKPAGSGSEDSDEEDSDKKKGVEGLIEIENPNRVAQKSKKVTEIELEGPKQLSRREREEIEKQKAKERYMKMHLAGKTDKPKQILLGLLSFENSERRQQRKKMRRGKQKKQQRQQLQQQKDFIHCP